MTTALRNSFAPIAATLLVVALWWASNSVASAPVEKTVVYEGATAQINLGPMTKEDGVTLVTPLDAYCRIDYQPASSVGSPTPTALMPTTHFPTLASSMSMTIPASANHFVATKAKEEDHTVQCGWEWLPGTCSITLTTQCSVNGDCPTPQTCERRKGVTSIAFLLRKKPFTF